LNYSLIIPIYNEARTLDKLLNDLDELSDNIEIIIVNDGSTDGTKYRLDKSNSFKIIHNSKNLGKGSSIIIGERHATTQNIILMDGDLEIDMKSIKKCITVFKENNNAVVVGSRWNEKSQSGLNINTLGNFIINYIFNFLYKTNLNDVLCCVKIIRKDILRSLNLRSEKFGIEIELMSKLAIKGTEFFEVNVVYNRRKNSQGKKLKISDSFDIIWTMIKLGIKSK
tara:strand:+ start:1042 stop:1716 length:675 start_codon:yes stop_codon:yes gene_type:complete